IEGKADGTIEYAMDGAAGSDFRYNRIGLCVLHPIRGGAWQEYQAITPQGVMYGRLPELIAPQRMENGFEVPLFPSFSSLTILLEDGSSLTSDFEGDLFEMEDQRNWTDGSFKTYSTPLSLGYPCLARAGQIFRQKVTLTARIPEQERKKRKTEVQQAAVLTLGKEMSQRLPKLGFGLPARYEPWGAREVEYLSRLRHDHLKLELHLQEPDWPEILNRAAAAAKELGCLLELALFLEDHPQAVLEQLRVQVTGLPVARVIVFAEMEAAVKVTSPVWIELARQYLEDALPGIPFFGGTNGNFAQLNRQPPDVTRMDGAAYPLNPQVHAGDERSMIEALEAQRDTLLTARSCCGDRPISISSVTLKPPFNQSATEKGEAKGIHRLPDSVDRRQVSLFASAWTVGSLQSLASGGAESITYYETSGWRGLFEPEHGSPIHEQFPSYPGMIFPLYHLFAFLGEARGARLLYSKSDHPLCLGGLALQRGERVWILLANYLPKAQEVWIRQIPQG
ncbi:MAG: hypothetical protein IH586_04220, partial [Anaerolineaceae bacterium]|nr:hypothetical protein [Anaerolineaceae bacterium]